MADDDPSLRPAAYALLALVSGLVVDRVGAGRALGGGLVVLGAAHALRGLAPGFLALLGATLVLGVGGTAITFGLPKLVADPFPAERTRTASSIYLVGASLGTAAAFALGRPYLEPLFGGWHPVFVWSGVLVAGLGLGWVAPLVRSIPIELDGIGPRLTATPNGFVFTVGEVGGFAGPFLVVAAGYLMTEPADYSADSGGDSGTSGYDWRPPWDFRATTRVTAPRRPSRFSVRVSKCNTVSERAAWSSSFAPKR